MWHIMKAEISYSRYLLLASLGAIVLISIVGELDNDTSNWLA